jgi:glutathione S-transferase
MDGLACRKAAGGAVLESLNPGGTSMAYVDIVTALALLQYLVFGFKVGRARGLYSVKAPAVAGNEIFERHFRVHQNTLEQLIVFLPGLFLFSHYIDPRVAAVLGVIYLVGRELFAFNYVKEPSKREVGYALSFLPAVILVLGGLFGAVRSLFLHQI